MLSLSHDKVVHGKGYLEKETVLVVCNFTPIVRCDYRIRIPLDGYWAEILNSNAKEYGGEGSGNFGGKLADTIQYNGRKYSLSLTLPPLAVIFLKYDKRDDINIENKEIILKESQHENNNI